MGSAFLCTLVSLYGMLKYSWTSFKILKNSIQQSHYKVVQDTVVDDGGKEEKENESVKLLNLLEENERRENMRGVLHFWSVFAVITIYEYYLEIFVFWVPFYYTLKFSLLLWIAMPQTKGATTLFKNVIEPRMLKHQKYIDEVLVPRSSTTFRNTIAGIEDIIMGSAAIHILTDDQVEELCMYYEKKLNTLVEERNRRKKKAEEYDGYSESKYSSREEKFEERKGEELLTQVSGSGSSWAYSAAYISNWFYSKSNSDANSNNIQKPENKEMVSSENWIASSLGGVMTLACTTGDIILRRKSSQDLSTSESVLLENTFVLSKRDSGCNSGEEAITSSGEKTTEQELVKGGTNNKIESRDSPQTSLRLSKFAEGFDSLKDYEDSEHSIDTSDRTPGTKKRESYMDSVIKMMKSLKSSPLSPNSYSSEGEKGLALLESDDSEDYVLYSPKGNREMQKHTTRAVKESRVRTTLRTSEIKTRSKTRKANSRKS
mmetsp:Transcript_36281/g.45331  ORF Transcript_36281/g.45331 Transcript_36281/m.45331 type:complete len:488 (+) Transcript_36281:332-1795(+)